MIKGIKVAFADIHYRVGYEYYFGGKAFVIGSIEEVDHDYIKDIDHGFKVLDTEGAAVAYIYKHGNGIILEYV